MFRSGNIKSVSKNPDSAKNRRASDDISSDQRLVAVQEELKTSYSLQDYDESKVMQQMKDIYSLQKSDIDQKLLVSEIKITWPFLFQQNCMFQHLEIQLNCSNYLQKFTQNMSDGSIKLYEYVYTYITTYLTFFGYLLLSYALIRS